MDSGQIEAPTISKLAVEYLSILLGQAALVGFIWFVLAKFSPINFDYRLLIIDLIVSTVAWFVIVSRRNNDSSKLQKIVNTFIISAAVCGVAAQIIAFNELFGTTDMANAGLAALVLVPATIIYGVLIHLQSLIPILIKDLTIIFVSQRKYVAATAVIVGFVAVMIAGSHLYRMKIQSNKIGNCLGDDTTCVAQEAIKQKDFSYCDNLEGSFLDQSSVDRRKDCYKIFTDTTKKDLQLCEKMTTQLIDLHRTDYSNYGLDMSCIEQLAISKNDPLICERYVSLVDKRGAAICYIKTLSEVNLQRSDVQLCSKMVSALNIQIEPLIDDNKFKEKCFSTIITKLRDPSACDVAIDSDVYECKSAIE